MAFINSSEIRIYPISGRVDLNTSDGTDIVTEANLAEHIKNLFSKDGFVVSYDNPNIKFYLGGYLFEVNLTTLSATRPLYAHISITPGTEISFNTLTAATAVNGECPYIEFDSNSTGGTHTLQLLDNSGNVPSSSYIKLTQKELNLLENYNDKVIVSNSTIQKLEESTITTAELNCLSGINSNIQTQLSNLGTRIDDLDLNDIGSDGNYIKLVSQTDGLVNATAAAFDPSIPITNPSTKTAPTSKAVREAINALDVSNITTNLGVGKTLTALSQTDGKIAATASNISITSSQVNDTVSTIDNSNNIPKSKAVKNYADSNLALKMNKYDPIGTGKLSLNRKANSTEGNYSVAIGYNTTASGDYSHAEGGYTKSSGYYSHAEGYGTTASGDYSHAEGNDTTASGNYSHAEGYRTKSSGYYSHAEGNDTAASGYYSHAEGGYTTASGYYSHAEGYGTTASGSAQHVFGKYNIEDTSSTYIEVVGNGPGERQRNNARTLDWYGNEWLAGALKLNKTTLTNTASSDININLPASSGSLVSYTRLRGAESTFSDFNRSWTLSSTVSSDSLLLIRGVLKCANNFNVNLLITPDSNYTNQTFFIRDVHGETNKSFGFISLEGYVSSTRTSVSLSAYQMVMGSDFKYAQGSQVTPTGNAKCQFKLSGIYELKLS